MSTSFSYTALDPSGDIRLVLLEPGDKDSPLTCSLITVKLDENPVYEALSYVWGSQDSPRFVVLDGQPKPITSNLWSALFHLRGYDQIHHSEGQDIVPRCLWIDAICINQDDVSERNHQVQQMGRIYSQAATVLVWLGPESDGSDLAMKALKDKSFFKSEIYWFDALMRLFGREYWKRIWVVQEIGLARQLKIHCGFQMADWSGVEYLRRTHKFLLKRGLTFKQTLLLQRSLVLRVDKHRMDHKRTGAQLHQLLDTCQSCQCSDPRDKVYALLGFADDCGAESIEVDYSKFVFDVFRDVVKFLFLRLPPEDSIRFFQNLQRTFGVRADMDRGMDEVKNELQSFPKLVIRVFGVRNNTQIVSYNVFHRSDVSKAFAAARIIADLDQIATFKSSKTTIHSSFAINNPDSVSIRYGYGVFENEDSYEWRISDTLSFFHACDNHSRAPIYIGPDELIGLTSTQVKLGDNICQFRGTDVAGIIRPSAIYHDKYEIVGRALLFASAKSWRHRFNIPRMDKLMDWTAAIGPTQPVRYMSYIRNSKNQCSLFLDIETLQRLTR